MVANTCDDCERDRRVECCAKHGWLYWKDMKLKRRKLPDIS